MRKQPALCSLLRMTEPRGSIPLTKLVWDGGRGKSGHESHVSTVPCAWHNRDNLLADLGVEEGDIDVLLELLDERSPELSDELAAFLRRCSTHTASAPRLLGSTGRMRLKAPSSMFGLGGPDPTA